MSQDLVSKYKDPPVVVRGFSSCSKVFRFSVACGWDVNSDQGSNPCPARWILNRLTTQGISKMYIFF